MEDPSEETEGQKEEQASGDDMQLESAAETGEGEGEGGEGEGSEEKATENGSAESGAAADAEDTLSATEAAAAAAESLKSQGFGALGLADKTTIDVLQASADSELLDMDMLAAIRTQQAPDGSEVTAPAAVVRCLDSIERNCWDTGAWKELNQASTQHNWQRREVLRAFVAQYPTSGEMWRRFIEFDLNGGSYATADATLARAMAVTGFASLELWDLKILRTRTIYDDAKASRERATSNNLMADQSTLAKEEAAQRALEDTFEEALSFVGSDFHAAKLWTNYLRFLREWPERTTLDAAIKLDKIRTV